MTTYSQRRSLDRAGVDMNVKHTCHETQSRLATCNCGLVPSIPPRKHISGLPHLGSQRQFHLCKRDASSANCSAGLSCAYSPPLTKPLWPPQRTSTNTKHGSKCIFRLETNKRNRVHSNGVILVCAAVHDQSRLYGTRDRARGCDTGCSRLCGTNRH